MRVIVTGGTGFIGGSLVKKLLGQGHDVQVIARTVPPPDDKNLEGAVYHSCDLSARQIPPSILSGVDLIFHVAAKAGVAGTYSSYHSANYQATLNVLESCLSTGIPRLVYTSTPSVTFSGKPIRAGTESLPYAKDKVSYYSLTKAMAEKAVLEAHDPGKLQTLALRPHLVWGEGDPHLLPRVISRHKEGKLKIVGDGKNQVDLTHVDNVCHAHLCAMKTLLGDESAGGKAYFISQDEPVRLWPWLNHLFAEIGLPPLEKSIGFGKAHFAGLVLEKIWRLLRFRGDPPMTRFVACQLAHDHWFSPQAAKADLGYEPIANMEQCLEKSLPWLRNL
ncbi:MAG: NAD-dependent epimerase/dehydratase family protein [Opitutae bacterium]|jgi:2-alkyl-3-oxoalkanoate reductase|nr:NAD-dependent epimerase/dehydratase family protein [Opitutae bacterium]